MLGYHGTTLETFASCARFSGERLPVTPGSLRFDNCRDPRNAYHRGVAYHYLLRQAVSDSLNDAFEHGERPLVLAGPISDVMALSARLPFGVRFPVSGLYYGRDGWRELEPLLVQDGEQEFLQAFGYLAAGDLFNRARRRLHAEKLGPAIDALAQAVLKAQREACERATAKKEDVPVRRSRSTLIRS